MNQKKLLIALGIIISCAATYGSSSGDSRIDSLSRKSYEYLSKGFEQSIYDGVKSKAYVNAWLQKAKTEKGNDRQLALAYKASIVNADKSLRLLYADSMIVHAKRTGDNEIIGSAFMTKGIIHYSRMEHNKALDSYLIADRYIVKVGNPQLEYKIKYGIAQIKYHLGFYDEAISLLEECIAYFKDENDRAYLNSLHTLALSYTRVRKYDRAEQTNRLGIESGKEFEDRGMEPYFHHAQGLNEYFTNNYKTAIRNLSYSLPHIRAMQDSANESVAYFYIGQSYWALGHHEKAISYFKKVDMIFEKENCMLPELRAGYEKLIDYYKGKSDTKLLLYYIDQLLKVDKKLAVEYRHLLKKIVKEYDTRLLLNEKKAIENTVIVTRIGGSVIVLSMGGWIIYLIRRNRRNVRLFEELMKRNTGSPSAPLIVAFEHSGIDLGGSGLTKQDLGKEVSANNGKQTSSDISKDIEDAIVKKLEKFELTKKYLENDMNLSKMATILHTNSKYVTKVIAKHRGKGTIEYITELKLDYIIEMLKTDTRYRNYTNKALGDEAGFKTTQNFTRAFKSYTGITPTYFSSKLKRSAATDN